jgi:hypothetical protein
MSEQDLEVMEDVDVIETPEDEDLLEFKASMGDPSEVPEPVAKSGKGAVTKGAKAGHDAEDSATTAVKRKQSKPAEMKTKAGMINAMYGEMAKMKKTDLQAMYKKMHGIEEQYLGTNDSERLNGGKSIDPRFDSPGSHIDYHHRQSGGHMKSGGDVDKHRYQVAKQLGYRVEEVEFDDEVIEEDAIEYKPLAKISAEDIDLSEDMTAMFKGADLTEEAQEKIQTVFEAAVVSKVNEIVEKFAIESESDLEVTSTQLTEELTEKVDEYLDYVVQEWVQENKLAIENGVKADMVESFLKGMKGLFEEHYVDIPEEKVDVVEELIAKVDELEGKLNEETDKNVELLGKVKDFEKETVFAEKTGDLSDTQVEKLRGLAEGIDFVSEEDFSKKIDMLKSQYFDIDEETVSVVVDDENDPISLEEEVAGPTGAMAVYMNAISKSAKK